MGKKKLSASQVGLIQNGCAPNPTPEPNRTLEEHILQRCAQIEKEAAEMRAALFALPESIRAFRREDACKLGLWF